MDILDLDYELSNLRFRGINLNLDEKMQLEMALHTLHGEQNMDELQFWGKINGINNDYFIAVGVTFKDMFEFPQKKFYFCLSNDYTFKEMPGLNDQHKEFVDRDTSFFLGVPERKLIQKEGEEEGGEQPGGGEEEEEEEGAKKAEESDVSEPEEVKVPPKELTEIDRVNYVVHAIETDCQIAPAGAYKMTAAHQVRRNEAFQGLNADDSLKITSYLHFRNVLVPEKKKQLDLPSAPFDPLFLEGIQDDKPNGCWSFQHDLAKRTVLGRNLLWPGFNFYHSLNKNKFGCVYIGDGLKNLEL